ncbi:unnamed protein product [Urochloa humidicola]
MCGKEPLLLAGPGRDVHLPQLQPERGDLPPLLGRISLSDAAAEEDEDADALPPPPPLRIDGTEQSGLSEAWRRRWGCRSATAPGSRSASSPSRRHASTPAHAGENLSFL